MPKIDYFPEFVVIFCKKRKNLPDYFYLRCSDIMDRPMHDGLLSEKTLAYLLTLVPQSFMAISWIIIDIGENVSRGGGGTQYTVQYGYARPWRPYFLDPGKFLDPLF